MLDRRRLTIVLNMWRCSFAYLNACHLLQAKICSATYVIQYLSCHTKLYTATLSWSCPNYSYIPDIYVGFPKHVCLLQIERLVKQCGTAHQLAEAFLVPQCSPGSVNLDRTARQFAAARPAVQCPDISSTGDRLCTT